MTKKSCARESELVAAVLAECVPDELRTHADSCPICTEVARVATLLHDDCVRAQGQANAPSADVVWLRAQIRGREEAARMAARPIVFTQAIAIAALLGLLVSVASRLSFAFLLWPVMDDASLHLVQRFSIVVLCCAVLAPVALYLAFARD